MQFSRFIVEGMILHAKRPTYKWGWDKTLTVFMIFTGRCFLNAFFLIIIILPLVLLYSLNFLRTNMVTET